MRNRSWRSGRSCRSGGGCWGLSFSPSIFPKQKSAGLTLASEVNWGVFQTGNGPEIEITNAGKQTISGIYIVGNPGSDPAVFSGSPIGACSMLTITGNSGSSSGFSALANQAVLYYHEADGKVWELSLSGTPQSVSSFSVPQGGSVNGEVSASFSAAQNCS